MRPTLRTSTRHTSLWSKIKEVDSKVNKLGDEKTQASKTTVKWLRIVGLSSTMVLLGVLGYTGAYIEE